MGTIEASGESRWWIQGKKISKYTFVMITHMYCVTWDCYKIICIFNRRPEDIHKATIRDNEDDKLKRKRIRLI